MNFNAKKYLSYCLHTHCIKNIHLRKNNIPLGSKLFFLVHVIFGVGLPVAEHSKRTGAPFFTCKCPPDVT